MKVLVSAIACNPYLGSENYFGWSAARCLARDHELWVLTSHRNREPLARAKAEGLVPDNLHFVFAGRFKEWHRHQMMARAQSWREYLFFTKDIPRVAQGLQREVGFDLVHHVTYATWRVASPLWQLGVPFVFGPIGGCEQFPWRFMRFLSLTAAAFEVFRMLSNFSSAISPSVRACIRNSAQVLVANPETEMLVTRLRGSPADVTRLASAFYSAARVKEFLEYRMGKTLSGPLRLFAGGKLEGRKGVALALEALAHAKKQGVAFRYQVGSQGPELAYLRRLVRRLDLEAEVAFIQPLSGDAYLKELRATHVFLLPSLRENAGLTMMEAMLAGCVPVVADGGGPGCIVTADSGFKVPATTVRDFVEGLERAILALDRNRELIVRVGTAAAQRIATGFSEENYRKTINAVYQSAVRKLPDQSKSRKQS